MFASRIKSPQQMAQYLKSYNQLVKVSFWFGAGASASAGIPTADVLAEQINVRFPYLEEDEVASDVSPFATAFSRLAPLGKKLFLHEAKENAVEVNQAHRMLARLARHGWVNLILTGNFDNLIIRAMHQERRHNPWIVNLPLESATGPDVVRPGSVVYLNGIRESFRTYSARKEIQPVAEMIRRVFERAVQNSFLVVVGYSGQDDPLLDLLSEMKEFPQGLFWVTDSEVPEDHLQEKILKIPGAQFLGGYDADEFMEALAVEGLGLGENGTVVAPTEVAVKPEKPAKKAPKKKAAPEKAPVEEPPPEKAVSEEETPEAETKPAAPPPIPEDERAIKVAHESMVVGGSDELYATAQSALDKGLENAFGPLAEALLSWGNELFDDGKLDKAQDAFRLVTELVPDKADGYTALGKVAEKKGDTSLATRMSLKAYQLNRR